MVSGVDRDGAALPGQLLHHPAGQGTQSWQKVQLCVIIKLGQAHRLTQDIVLGHRVWNKLMERECLFKQRGRDFVQNRIQVLDIVHLLKSMEDPLPHLRDLLGQICKRFPPTDPSLVGEERFVRVSQCHLNGSRKVGVNGFLLLEAAEAALGSTEQRFELFVVDYLGDDLLVAVASRLARLQTSKLDISETRVEVQENLSCKNQEDVKAISFLMQNCHSVDIDGSLFIPNDIGREGWAALGEALSCNKLQVVPRVKTLDKSCMASAERKDLRSIWECLSLLEDLPGQG